MWDHNYTLYIDKLESVQKFATKVILRDWNSCYNNRMKLLNLPLLSIRRKRQSSLYAIELCLFVLLSLPASLLRIPVRLYVMPITCHYTILGSEPLPISHLFMLVLFLFGTLYTGPLCLLLALVLYVSVIPLWNTLHRTIVSSPGSSSLC